MNRQKRQIKLINRDFQYRLMAKFILIYGVMAIIFGALLYVFFDSEISANLFSAHVAYRSVAQMLLPIFSTLTLLNIIIAGIMTVSAVLYWSHKIAGPLYRFNETLASIATRNLKPMIAIRTDDQLKAIAANLEKVSVTLGSDLSELKKTIYRLDDLCIAAGNVTPEPVKEKIAELKQVIDKYTGLN